MNSEYNSQPTEVQRFFEGAQIFITGGSGFLGNLLIQKLIRACPGLTKIYVLMRPKKGKAPQDRLNLILEDVVFDKMKEEQPNYFEKLQVIYGDCEEECLGISEEDKKYLEQVNVVFHSAATVNFCEHIKKATNINVKATKDIVTLARNMPNLKAFVHISTAFCNCIDKVVDENFFDMKMTPNKLILMTESLANDELDALSPIILGSFPNTYTYTKAIAENVVKELGSGLPITIVRPGMVTSTWKDPLEGWVNNIYGPIGIGLGTSLGLMHVVNTKPNIVLDMVPADYLINAIIVASWNIHKSHQDKNERGPVFRDLKVEENIPIFNYISSKENSINADQFRQLSFNVGYEYVTMKMMWYPFVFFALNKVKYNVLLFLFHILPAYIIDAGLYIFGKKPIARKLYQKSHKMLDSFKYFMDKDWHFENDNTQALWRNLNMEDKKLFPFSMADFYWYDYFKNAFRGGRIYLIKDPLDTLPQAEIRFKKLTILHYVVCALLLYLFFKLGSFILNIFV